MADHIIDAAVHTQIGIKINPKFLDYMKIHERISAIKSYRYALSITQRRRKNKRSEGEEALNQQIHNKIYPISVFHQLSKTRHLLNTYIYQVKSLLS